MLKSRIKYAVIITAVLFLAGCEKTDNTTTKNDQTVPQQNQQTTAPQQNQTTPQQNPPTVPQEQMSPIPIQQQPPQQTPQQKKIQGTTNKRVALFKCPQMNSEEIDTKITEKLKKVKGVLDVRTNHINTFLIKVLYDGDKTGPQSIKDAVKEAGYESELSEDKEMK